MSSRRRKREMWMWWLTPTCSTLLYYTGKRERRRRRKKNVERRRAERKLRESDVRMCTISVSLSLFLPPEWWVVSFLSLSLFVEFFFLRVSPIHTKNDEHAQNFFLLFAWWTLNYLLFLSLTRARTHTHTRSRCYDYINNSFDQWEELEKKKEKKKTVDRWE